MVNKIERPAGWKPVQFRKEIWLRNKKIKKVINKLEELKISIPSDKDAKAIEAYTLIGS